MKNESQQALLLLRQYLYQQTDEQHPVSVTDIPTFWQRLFELPELKLLVDAVECSWLIKKQTSNNTHGQSPCYYKMQCHH